MENTKYKFQSRWINLKLHINVIFYTALFSLFIVSENLMFAQAPGNTCAAAVALTSPAIGSFIETGVQSTCGRGNNIASGFSSVNTSYGGGEDAYYSLTVPAGGGNYTFAFFGGGATWKILSIHSACAPAVANTVGGFVTGSSANGTTTLNLNAGTYRLVIDTWPTPNCGNFNLRVTRNASAVPPVNDACANATPLPCGTTGLAGTTVNSVVETAPSGCASQRGVWYTFTGDGQQTTLTSTTTFDHELTIVSGSCGSFTNITCVDASTGTETFTFMTTSALQYYVYVAHWQTTSTTTGTFSISRSCLAPLPANPTSITATSNTICSGQSTTLTANGAVGIVYWFTGLCSTTGEIGTGSSLSVSPTSTTTYFARNLNGGQWSANCASLTIVVNQPPTGLTAAASSPTICSGESVNLTASATLSGGSIIHQAQNEADFLSFVSNDTKWGYATTNAAGGTSPELFFNWTPSSTGTFWAQFGNSINATGFTNVSLQFRHFYDYYSVPFTLRLQTSPDASTWTDRWTSSPTANVTETVNVNLNVLSNTTFFYRFVAEGNSFNTDGWWIDDIVISGTPPPITYAWTSAPVGFVSSLQNPTASPLVNTIYTVSAIFNGCSVSTNVPVTVNQPSVASTGIAGVGSICHGNEVVLSPIGGTLASGANWEWFTGSCGGTAVGTGNSITVSPTSTTQYFVRASASGVCPATTCANGTVTLPTQGAALANNGENATCTVTENNWVHFYHASGRLLASINSGGQNLGNVTVTSYVDGANAIVPACDLPSVETAVLQRHWVITPQFQPASNVLVRLPFGDAEVSSLAIAAGTTSNTQDNSNGIPNLKLSRYHGPSNVNASALDNCSANGGNGNTEIHTGSASGTTNGYSNVFGEHYNEYSIPEFSEFWLHWQSDNSPLPVVLSAAHVDCLPASNQVVLQWTTSSELNSYKFLVQRSRNGELWGTIGQVQGAGNSSSLTEYTFTDLSAFAGQSYYRIIQYDFDGTATVYGPWATECAENNGITVYPNPTAGKFVISISSEEDQKDAILEIIDLSGKVISSEEILIESGSTEIYRDLSGLNAGTYLLVIRTQKQLFEPLRIVKGQ